MGTPPVSPPPSPVFQICHSSLPPYASIEPLTPSPSSPPIRNPNPPSPLSPPTNTFPHSSSVSWTSSNYISAPSLSPSYPPSTSNDGIPQNQLRLTAPKRPKKHISLKRVEPHTPFTHRKRKAAIDEATKSSQKQSQSWGKSLINPSSPLFVLESINDEFS